MRYYLDTNVLIFVLFDKYRDELSGDVLQIVEDYSNVLYVSSIVVRELVQLYKDGDLVRDVAHKSAADLFHSIEKLGIEIVPMNKYHLMRYAELNIASGHKDPNDHIIIAQSIADKIPVISSDRKFKEYIGQGLSFVFNRR